MLSLKNPFAKSIPATRPPIPVPEAEAKLNEKELRIEADVTRFTATLAEAEQAREIHTKALGERASDGLDTTEAAQQVRQDDETIRELKAGLAVVIQKRELVLAERRQANRQSGIEKKAAAIARARASAVKVERVLAEMASSLTEFTSVITEIKDLSEGDTIVGHQLGITCNVFRPYLNRSCSALIPEGTAYSETLDKDKKPFAAWIDDLEYAVLARHRP